MISHQRRTLPLLVIRCPFGSDAKVRPRLPVLTINLSGFWFLGQAGPSCGMTEVVRDRQAGRPSRFAEDLRQVQALSSAKTATTGTTD